MVATTLLIVLWFVVGGSVGYTIGRPKGRAAEGIFLGVILGVVGWIIVAVMSAATPADGSDPSAVADMRDPKRPGAGYWVTAAVLIVFGFLGSFSIGLPFLLLGVVMLAVSPWSKNRSILVPALAVPFLFTAGFLAISPLGCTVSATSVSLADGTQTSGDSITSCNGLFVHYDHQPALWPRFALGIIVAIVGAALLHLALRAWGSRPRVS